MVERESRKMSKLYWTLHLWVRFTISVTEAHGRMIKFSEVCQRDAGSATESVSWIRGH